MAKKTSGSAPADHAPARSAKGPRQILAISEGERTYVPGNAQDEADLAELMTAEQRKAWTARGAFAAEE